MPDEPKPPSEASVIPPRLQLIKGQSEAIVLENARRLMQGRGLPRKVALHQAAILAGYRPVWKPDEEPNSEASPNSTKPSSAVH